MVEAAVVGNWVKIGKDCVIVCLSVLWGVWLEGEGIVGADCGGIGQVFNHQRVCEDRGRDGYSSEYGHPKLFACEGQARGGGRGVARDGTGGVGL